MKKLLGILLFLSACIEPYDFEVRDTETVLVVEGSVNNLSGQSFVQLQYSYALEGADPVAITGAQVSVVDDLGNRETFNEVGPGRYTPNAAFKGIVGRRYQLFIQTPDGNEYRSSQEELLEPGVISNIYGRFLSLRSESSDGFDNGVQFLVDIEEADEDIHNYRLEYTEDYEVTVPYESLLVYNPTTGTIDRRQPPIGLCYINTNSNGLYLGTTSSQVKGDLLEYPMVFIKDDQQKLLGRYSLTVRSYRISGSTYQYYTDLKENNESAGSFFDRQKGAIIGNIQDLNEPTTPVLGYFEVAGVSEAFELFDTNTWREDGYNPQRNLLFCRQLLDTVRTVDILNDLVDFEDRNIYNFASTEAILPENNYNVLTVLAPPSCSDCRLYGTLNKPSFWD